MQFLSSVGLVVMQVFSMLIIYLLFCFIVPAEFGQLLKWASALSAVAYSAQWLAMKLVG